MSSSYETESEILTGLGKDTEDDSVNAVPQILLGVICFRPKNKSFFVGKRTSYISPWTRDSQCQISAHSLARNTPNAS